MDFLKEGLASLFSGRASRGSYRGLDTEMLEDDDFGLGDDDDEAQVRHLCVCVCVCVFTFLRACLRLCMCLCMTADRPVGFMIDATFFMCHM